MSTSGGASVQDTPTTVARLALGGFTSPSQRLCQTFIAEHNTGNADCSSSVRADACLHMLSVASASAGIVDVQSLDSTGFTLVMDAIDTGAQKPAFYLALGDAPVVATRSRPPRHRAWHVWQRSR